MIYSRIVLFSIRKIFFHLKSSFRLSSTSRPIYYESVSQHANNIALIDHSSSYKYSQLYRRLIPFSLQQQIN
jgi:hypothetical protein